MSSRTRRRGMLAHFFLYALQQHHFSFIFLVHEHPMELPMHRTRKDARVYQLYNQGDDSSASPIDVWWYALTHNSDVMAQETGRLTAGFSFDSCLHRSFLEEGKTVGLLPSNRATPSRSDLDGSIRI